MKLDQALVDAAIRQLEARFPNAEGIAAALYTEQGDVLTSVFFEPEWGGGGLCAETGAILEAHRRNQRVVAIVCMSRLSGDSPIVVLTPCGICQERLFHWGPDVEVGVPHPDDPTRWMTRTLKDVQPYYWVKAFGAHAGNSEPKRLPN